VSRKKGNIGKPPPTLAYRITQVGEAENMPRISWLGERETSAEAALASQSGGGDAQEGRHSLSDAKDFLRAELVEDVSAEEMYERAKNAGIAKRTLERARTELGVKAGKRGFGKDGEWFWPKIANTTDKDRLSPNLGGLSAEIGSNGASEADSAKDRQVFEGDGLSNMNGGLDGGLSDGETGEVPDYDPAA
jgi:hypothetical protein